MLFALLLLAAAPVTDEVAGAPPAAPRLAAPEPHGSVPARWYLDDDSLSSTKHASQLYEESAAGPKGDATGTACELTVPSSFHFAHAVLSSRDLPFRVVGGSVLYAPRVLKRPLQVTVWRNNAAGKDPMNEVVLGILTLGLSTLRLVPTVATTVSAPPNGVGRSGGFSLQCRTVGENSVRAVRNEKAAECTSLACLSQEVSLVGPDDPELNSRAQQLADDTARKLAEWRRQTTWSLRSFDILSSTHCGTTCVKLTVKNTSSRTLDFPRFDSAIDAHGQRASVYAENADQISPGETRVLKLSVTSSDGPMTSRPSFPVVVRTYSDRWVHDVPGDFTEDGIEYRFTAESRCENGKVLLPVMMRCLAGSGSSGADVAWLKDNNATSVHVSWCRPGEVTEEPAWAWTESGQECSSITAVSGGSTAAAYVLVP